MTLRHLGPTRVSYGSELRPKVEGVSGRTGFTVFHLSLKLRKRSGPDRAY